MKIGFDNEKYLTLQAEQIRRRRAQFGDKLGGRNAKGEAAFTLLPLSKVYFTVTCRNSDPADP